jgi:hypothetical protein
VRTTFSTTGKTRRAPVVTTFAAICLAIPMVALSAGTAFAATADASSDVAAKGNSEAAHAAAAVKKDDDTKVNNGNGSENANANAAVAHPADFIGPVAPATSTTSTDGSNANTTSVPFTNQGGVTTGSNTTKYEVVNGRSGSPAVGGGQPSGDVMKPQPYSKADSNNTGANDTSTSNPYKSTRDGAPSLNGNGGGKAVGQPCAGCVGKADNKNPKGQAPGGSDHNAGYECDRNHGIGRSNPAHTGCKPPVACVPTSTQDKFCHESKCVPTSTQDQFCHESKCVPTSTQDPFCHESKCVPTSTQDPFCHESKCVPTAQQDKDCKTPGNACVPVGNEDKNCNPPKDCLGVVNGHATADMCKPPCPTAGTMGPVPAGCGPITGGGGGPATTPVVGRTVTPAKVVTPVAGTTPGPGTALPFTGANTGLLLDAAALMLLVGAGLMVATRKPKPALALV